MKLLVKKSILISFVLLMIVVSGCGQFRDKPGTNETSDVSNLPCDTSGTPDLPSDSYGDPVSGSENDENMGHNYEDNVFLELPLFHISDGFIYDYERDKRELRKYSYDLLQNERVFSSGSSAIVSYSPEGYCLISMSSQLERFYPGHPDYAPSIREWSIVDIYNGSSQVIDLPSVGQNFVKIIIYKGNIFLIDHNNGRRLDMYDIKGNFVKTVCSEYVDNFGIIEDAVYYIPNPDAHNQGRTLMRYDIKEDIAEKVFEFNLKKSLPNDTIYWPEASYNGRYIIIQNSQTSIMYTSIDDINPIEVEFNSTRSPWDDVTYIRGTGDDLCFMYKYGDEKDSEGEFFGEFQYFKINQGIIEPISSRTQRGSLRCIIDGYIYYGEKGTIQREKLE